MLGIIIGIAGVITIISVGNGAEHLIIQQVKSQGSNLIAIFPGNTEEEGPPASVFGIVITTLKLEDVQKLTNNLRLPYIEHTSGYVQGTDRITWQGEETTATFVGGNASIPEIESTTISTGHFFTEDDVISNQKVTVLGFDIAQELFGDQDPIQKRIKIGKHNFRIIGVMSERGTSGFTNQDRQIYVPITTAQKLLLGINHISFARAKISDEHAIQESKESIKEILREQHNLEFGEPNDFDVRSQTDALDALLSITKALRLFLTAIASIALLVGGIGIMNIMLASVEERIREIGIRKAVGAKKSHIISQFLIESIILTLIAGILGIFAGIGISFMIAKIVQLLGFEWKFIVPLYSLLLSAGVSGTIGLVFGLLPAKKAGKLNPIEALRYE
jgi:ABC-type antimicrobial peptide transport system permease subunit